jgi:hypothetical protein
MQPRAAISMFCSGPERTDARGMRGLVPVQLTVVISISCSRPERMDAHGLNLLQCTLQLVGVISISYSGPENGRPTQTG